MTHLSATHRNYVAAHRNTYFRRRMRAPAPIAVHSQMSGSSLEATRVVSGQFIAQDLADGPREANVEQRSTFRVRDLPVTAFSPVLVLKEFA